jgi:hypothetical protein
MSVILLLHVARVFSILQPLFSGGDSLATRYHTMPRFLSAIAAFLAGIALGGCVSSPWSADKSAAIPTSTPAPSKAAAATPSSATPSSATPASSNPQQMQDVMSELRQLGTLDPAAQDRLMEDLRQTDPSLWPLVMQQFRATAAYRRRAAEQAGATTRAERLPAVNDAAIAPTEAPQEAYPSTPQAVVEGQPSASAPPDQLMPATYTVPSADWRQRLTGTIEALEAEVARDPSAPGEMAEQARLRMLYAAAGRREDAARPIAEAPPPTQEFLSKELDGLTAWFDAEKTPDPSRRAAETKPELAEALAKLAEAAPLAVRNVAFCTEVQSYGCAKRFERYAFEAHQEVLLYAEVENFASEFTPKGYHTSLRSSYELLDVRGQRVAQQAFAATEEYCQNLRRDFFIGYHLRLPKEIGPGKYTLQLSIEDLKCQKVGQASIEFEIEKRKGDGARGKG